MTATTCDATGPSRRRHPAVDGQRRSGDERRFIGQKEERGVGDLVGPPGAAERHGAGRALLNKKVGDEVIVVSPNGKREMEILSLSTIHDEIEPEKAGA